MSVHRFNDGVSRKYTVPPDDSLCLTMCVADKLFLCIDAALQQRREQQPCQPRQSMPQPWDLVVGCTPKTCTDICQALPLFTKLLAAYSARAIPSCSFRPNANRELLPTDRIRSCARSRPNQPARSFPTDPIRSCARSRPTQPARSFPTDLTRSPARSLNGMHVRLSFI